MVFSILLKLLYIIYIIGNSMYSSIYYEMLGIKTYICIILAIIYLKEIIKEIEIYV